MNKFMTTFNLTFFSKIKAKSFIFTTLIIIAGMFIAFNLDKIINLFNSDDEALMLEVDAEESFLTVFEPTLASFDDTIEIVDSDGSATLEIVSTEPLQAEIRMDEEISDTREQNIQLALNETNRAYVLQTLNLSEAEISQMYEEVPVDFLVASEEGSGGFEAADADETNILNMVIFYFSVILMFIILISYASQIATEIANEKSSRVIEMIVSSIRPTQHLMAKIFAMIAVSVLQIVLITIGGLIAFYFSDTTELLDQFGLEANDQTLKIIIYCIIFVILGLILYLSVSAMLGSFINRMEDLQQGLMPVTFLSMIGYFIALGGISFADNIAVTITSYFPFFTPFVMPLRLLVNDTGHAPMIIGIVIMIITIIITLLLAGYIYKRSVLSTESGIMKNIKRIRK
ncbi:ABC-2 family transporter protein [Jeotgalicoccus aerolatus]|uniref:ABC-2 type transport system permease protein n=1 Tax=Jeotgalicoccus aerolatus TaxID=709510 RepID=A0ABS4HR29_9STAP|nr:ABC transporter permease [Jeotgalicoccus aerolatus]MBP1952817.1 ABC-2 type transport system permease protein [Jeotgalicoccus aerolatus]GGE07837.1 sodium ABC transporter permease [Jeotgalicoccus aerolatus]CAD2080636.1 ABC-2 family transporter protein [Jeotgalicoccus aerolatus]